MSLDIPIMINSIEEVKNDDYLTYGLDLDNGRISGRIDGLEAVNQFIRKALITPRFKCLVYDSQYGSEIKEVITANDASEELIRAEIPRLVKDAISYDNRIIKVYDFSFDIQREVVYIKFKVDTIYGATVFEGEI